MNDEVLRNKSCEPLLSPSPYSLCSKWRHCQFPLSAFFTRTGAARPKCRKERPTPGHAGCGAGRVLQHIRERACFGASALRRGGTVLAHPKASTDAEKPSQKATTASESGKATSSAHMIFDTRE